MKISLNFSQTTLDSYLKIIKILMTKGNLMLRPREATDEDLNDLSERKEMGAMTYTPTKGE